MDSIGAEVGQKMRSAIKAKLMELDCYVDDELPDYIMVMVANRRTKSQMNEDLNLFLASKTSTFVNWLHIVLKKLKEVTVTNPDVYKKAGKRKSVEIPPDDKNSLKLKKEKNYKKVKKEFQSQKSDDEKFETNQETSSKSLTDNLPMSVNKLSEKRKIILTDSLDGPSNEDIAEDNFDIPLLSEVNESSNEQELQDIEKKIRNVKSRLGILVQSDNEEDSVNLKCEKDVFSKQVGVEDETALANSRQISILENEIIESENREAEQPSSTRNILRKYRDIEIAKEQLEEDKEYENEMWVEKKSQHKRITFEGDKNENSSSSRTVYDRIGNKHSHDRSPDRFRDRSPTRSPKKMTAGKKRSILDRLGKRPGSPDKGRKQISLSQYREEEDRFLGYHSEDHKKRSSSRDRDRTSRLLSKSTRDKRNSNSLKDRRNRSRSKDRSPHKTRDTGREGVLGRLGVQSKVAIIKKPELNLNSDEEETKVVREVPSLIKVKPRVIPSDVPQPNKNLLLKAVAEAQRSIAQTPKVGKDVKPDALYTKKYKEKISDTPNQKKTGSRKLTTEEKNKLKNIIQQSSNRMRSRLQQSSDEYDSDGEYIPKPVKNVERVVPSYTPSTKINNDTNSNEIHNDTKENGKQQFIITLDGIDSIEKSVFGEKKTPVKLRLEDKKSPSPIIFDKTTKSIDTCTRPNIPDKLPIVHPPLSVKNKERCKYWPGCRQGDKCEFVHPSQNCEMFPRCKFGDKCLFLHPKCKFGSSCTKRDCPYDHNIPKSALSSKLPIVPPVQHCKFFPNCTNLKCPFYHPKPCKYGKYCKNIADCTFSHSFVANKKSLSWRSK